MSVREPPPNVVPFTASWLAAIQIVQINALEFLKSRNSRGCEEGGGVLRDPNIFLERRHAQPRLAERPALLERQSRTQRQDL